MTLEANLAWRSERATHLDRMILADNAFLADGRWARAAAQARSEGDARLDASPWITPAGLPPAELAETAFPSRPLPIPGRFYPRIAFPGLAQGPRDLRPTRLLAREAGRLRADPNHPLAGADATLRILPTQLEAAPGHRLAELFDGPGIQVPAAVPETAYFAVDSFARQDETPDRLFYEQPRLVQHLDAACRGEIRRLQGRFLEPGMRVLDLMASWDSHLPDAPGLHVAGLGMNAAELAANPVLAERVVKDLNERPQLPWGDAQFDLILCTASIEYLTRPRAVLAEARRVLRPGGRLLLSFSDRWFSPKAIRIWAELHPFERLGLALALLSDAGFTELATETLRGMKRPQDDRYSEQRGHADPLFAAWGKA